MKISVITVAYNSASTIADTVCTVASQTYTDIEHLVVDGNSTDETVQTVQAYQHPRLILSSEPDKGIYDAMNKGMLRCTGDIIGFLNGDDFFEDNEVLEKVAKVFEDSQVDACFGDLVYVTADKKRVVRYWKSRPFKKGSFARGWSPAHPTFYIRRETLERHGLFDLTYHFAADIEFMMRYLELGNVRSIYIPHVLVHMRVGGTSNKSWRNIMLQNIEIFHAFKKNRVPYSGVLFWTHKITNRIWQRLAGLGQR